MDMNKFMLYSGEFYFRNLIFCFFSILLLLWILRKITPYIFEFVKGLLYFIITLNCRIIELLASMFRNKKNHFGLNVLVAVEDLIINIFRLIKEGIERLNKVIKNKKGNIVWALILTVILVTGKIQWNWEFIEVNKHIDGVLKMCNLDRLKYNTLTKTMKNVDEKHTGIELTNDATKMVKSDEMVKGEYKFLDYMIWSKSENNVYAKCKDNIGEIYLNIKNISNFEYIEWKSVKASSELSFSNKIFPAYNDNDFRSVWFENRLDEGIDEKIIFNTSEAVDFNYMVIANSNFQEEYSYKANPRVSKIGLIVDGNEIGEYDLKFHGIDDYRIINVIKLDNMINVNSYVEVEILAVDLSGTDKYKTTGISEMKFLAAE